MSGAVAPAASESLRAHVSVERTHVQPVPLIVFAVRPAGSVSTTVMVPTVAACPRFITVIVYDIPVAPWVKSPVWVFAIVRSGPSTLSDAVPLLLPAFGDAADAESLSV